MVFIDLLFVTALLVIIVLNLLLRKITKQLKNTPNETKLSGFEIARIVSNKLTKDEPHIIKKPGKLLDHYNVERNVLKLSEEVFDGENLYAGIVALNTALETDNSKKRISKIHKFTSIMVLISYVIILLGMLINNPQILRFGFIIFILAIIIEFLAINIIAQNDAELAQLNQFIKDCHVIEPFEENIDYINIMLILPIARLPFSFIMYFR